MDLLTQIAIALVGIFSGMIGATVGGSALIAIPVLMMLGAGPLAAIATNKFAMLSSAFTASWKYHRSGLIPSWKPALLPMIVTFTGAWAGSLLVLNVEEWILTLMVVSLLLVVLLVLILLPDLGVHPQKRRGGWIMHVKSTVVFGGLGLYLGFFGPGYGTFAIMGLIYVFGFTFVQSAAMMNLLGIAGLISSVSVFALTGQINYELGIPLMIGVAIGGWLGAHYAVLKGNVWLKRILIGITLILIANLIWKRVLPVIGG